jgi:hypothetical protein
MGGEVIELRPCPFCCGLGSDLAADQAAAEWNVRA